MGSGEASTKVDFCGFLTERGLLDTEAASSVRRRASEERTPIGQILITQGHLSVRQVMNVLEVQADEPSLRFGEIAVMKGYLTTLQLEDALQFQASHRRHQIAVLSQDGRLGRSTLEAAVVAYVDFLELQAAECMKAA